MEDRYEIRGKIGAGGLGTVYRGFDLKMKREVAIKRILTNPDDPTVQEEATKQLAAEAGDALGFLFRPAHAAREVSPAALRLMLEAAPGGLQLQVLKSRGAWSDGQLCLRRAEHSFNAL